MTRQIIEHTADVRLRVEAPTIEDLFREAMLGMFEIMSCSAGVSPAFIEVGIKAHDRTSLLVDFLNEVLSAAHIMKTCFDRIEFTKLDDVEISARVGGRAQARFEQDVKAVTYHEAEVRFENGIWSTMLVFDI